MTSWNGKILLLETGFHLMRRQFITQILRSKFRHPLILVVIVVYIRPKWINLLFLNIEHSSKFHISLNFLQSNFPANFNWTIFANNLAMDSQNFTNKICFRELAS